MLLMVQENIRVGIRHSIYRVKNRYITNTEKTMIKTKSHNAFNVGEEIIYMDG